MGIVHRGSAHPHGHGHMHDHDGIGPHGHEPMPGHGHAHPPGHNHPAPALHSHLHAGDGAAGRRDEIAALAATFIEGFRRAEDKPAFLRLAGVPLEAPGEDGLARKLVDVTIAEGYQVATASPGFGSRELVHLPYPAPMVKGRTTLTFVYVSLTGRTDLDLAAFLASRYAPETTGR